MYVQTRIVLPKTDLLAAVAILRAGGTVAFPTETVYGLGADARSADAVAAIYQAKGRPSTNPLIVHVADLEMAERYAVFNPVAERLARAFWPGPLTLVLPRREGGVTAAVSAGLSTVAIRVPRHPVAEALLGVFDGPIAAPSANRSGFTSPTTAQHVLAELNGRIPMILDGGSCVVGLESTVLDLTTPLPTLLRPGAVTAEMLREKIGEIRVVSTTVDVGQAAASPGLQEQHYAPRTPAFRVERGAWPLGELKQASVLLSHDPAMTLSPPHQTVLLPADAAAYANVLYAALRSADEMQMEQILVLWPETTEGIWLAIADRLRRATRPFVNSGQAK